MRLGPGCRKTRKPEARAAPRRRDGHRVSTKDPDTTPASFLLLALLWGSGLTFIKMSLEGLTTGQLVLSLLVLGAAVLLAVALARIAGVWAHVAAAALFGNVLPFLLLSYGKQSTGAGIAGLLIGGTPLLTTALAAVTLPTERATWRRTLGLLAGFGGTVRVIAPWRDAGGSVGGQPACLGAALRYAVSFVYVRKYLSPRGLPPLSLVASQLLAAAVLQAAVTPFLTRHTPEVTGRRTRCSVRRVRRSRARSEPRRSRRSTP